MAFSFKNHRGFSFMEMIVVIAIIMIMTVVMLVMSMQDREKKKFEAAGREISAAVREAQNNALTGKQIENTDLPCAMMFYADSNGFGVKGSFRTLTTPCGSDTETGSYDKAGRNTHFMQGELSSRNLKLQLYNYPPEGAPKEANGLQYLVYTVPYGKYIDNLSVTTGRNSTSLGTEMRVLDRDEGNLLSPEKMYYRICVHPTGLIEEMGIIEPSKDDDAKKCLFGTITSSDPTP